MLEATGVKIDWDVQEAGVDVMDKYGTPLPDSVLESIRRNKVALKGPITTPVGTGFRSVNVALRKELDLYACLRPCKTYPGVAVPVRATSTWSSSARTPRTCTPASSSSRASPRRPS